MKMLDSAKTLLTTYQQAITRLEGGLEGGLDKAVDLILSHDGHLVICGMGKSGLVGRKIAATLSSTGTPALFLHPAEAIHGDLGMVRQNDVMILISNSGETEEVVRLLPALKRLNVKIISLIGQIDSSLGRAADVILDASVDKEACPLNLAPTTSSMAALVLGDALAVVLMEQRGFQAEDFAARHPGGKLGQKLLSAVRDKMVSGNLPFVSSDMKMSEVIVTMTTGRLGLALVGQADNLEGIITDGDLRRMLVENRSLEGTYASEIMNASPQSISQNASLGEAEDKMSEAKIQSLVVRQSDDPSSSVCGIIQIY
ncbi:MAG: KpsF/GutQ family sugar-phosphate isomerase [Candidatus Puniceispirillaceae bacterium]